MRSISFLCILLVLQSRGLCQGIDPGSIDSASWIKGPLVKVSPDVSASSVIKSAHGDIRASLVEEWAYVSVSDVPKSEILPIGLPAFQKLSIEKRDVGPGEDPRWIVSGVICGTNAAPRMSNIAVYLGYPNGQLVLAALSNLKGEVLFDASLQAKWATSSGKAVAPVCLYIGGMISPSDGSILRKYKFEVAR